MSKEEKRQREARLGSGVSWAGGEPAKSLGESCKGIFCTAALERGSGEGQQQEGVHQGGTAWSIIAPLVMGQARLRFFQLEAYLWHVW